MVFKLASKFVSTTIDGLKMANGWSLYQAMKKALVGRYAVYVRAGLHD